MLRTTATATATALALRPFLELVELTGELDEQRWLAGPSWCTHEGVTVARGDRRCCLRCGAMVP